MLYGNGGVDFYIEDESCGDMSEMLGVPPQLEHPPAKGVKLEHQHGDTQLLHT
jgi:hypothetical protein